ncbi:hypothetical protein NT6N_34960 [Oceaniferula spumae]|uniref:Cytochrome B n=1 Tax=Oceaniferula spumae TaxID=2979115 RepID=A0AAT9FR05_9BACT
MKTTLEISGYLLVGLALLHGVFPRRFHWKNELADVSLLTRQIMHVHTFFIALIVLLMGLLCITSAEDLISTQLGRTIAGGLAVFWGCRLLVQFFGYSSSLWKGKAFETAIHIVFALLWVHLTTMFGLVAWGALLE